VFVAVDPTLKIADGPVTFTSPLEEILIRSVAAVENPIVFVAARNIPVSTSAPGEKLGVAAEPAATFVKRNPPMLRLPVI
jgi:hypothetical protein